MKKKLLALIHKWGYTLKGRELWSQGVRGYVSASFVRDIRDEFDAAEQLIALINDDRYYSEHLAITKPD